MLKNHEIRKNLSFRERKIKLKEDTLTTIYQLEYLYNLGCGFITEYEPQLPATIKDSIVKIHEYLSEGILFEQKLTYITDSTELITMTEAELNEYIDQLQNTSKDTEIIQAIEEVIDELGQVHAPGLPNNINIHFLRFSHYTRIIADRDDVIDEAIKHINFLKKSEKSCYLRLYDEVYNSTSQDVLEKNELYKNSFPYLYKENLDFLTNGEKNHIGYNLLASTDIDTAAFEKFKQHEELFNFTYRLDSICAQYEFKIEREIREGNTKAIFKLYIMGDNEELKVRLKLEEIKLELDKTDENQILSKIDIFLNEDSNTTNINEIGMELYAYKLNKIKAQVKADLEVADKAFEAYDFNSELDIEKRLKDITKAISDNKELISKSESSDSAVDKPLIFLQKKLNEILEKTTNQIKFIDGILSQNQVESAKLDNAVQKLEFVEEARTDYEGNPRINEDQAVKQYYENKFDEFYAHIRAEANDVVKEKLSRMQSEWNIEKSRMQGINDSEIVNQYEGLLYFIECQGEPKNKFGENLADSTIFGEAKVEALKTGELLDLDNVLTAILTDHDLSISSLKSSLDIYNERVRIEEALFAMFEPLKKSWLSFIELKEKLDNKEVEKLKIDVLTSKFTQENAFYKNLNDVKRENLNSENLTTAKLTELQNEVNLLLGSVDQEGSIAHVSAAVKAALQEQIIKDLSVVNDRYENFKAEVMNYFTIPSDNLQAIKKYLKDAINKYAALVNDSNRSDDDTKALVDDLKRLLADETTNGSIASACAAGKKDNGERTNLLRIAKDTSSREDLQKIVLCSGLDDVDIAKEVAQNNKCNDEIRQLILAKEYVDAEILNKISNASDDADILITVSTHPKCTDAEIAIILNKVDASIFNKIVTASNNATVLSAVANHDDCSGEVKAMIFSQADPELLSKIATDSNDAEILSKIINRSNCSDEIKDIIFVKADAEILKQIATDSVNNEILLRVITHNRCNDQVRAIAFEKVNESTLNKLATDSDKDAILELVVGHSECTDAIRLVVLKKVTDPNILNKIAIGSEDSEVLAKIVTHRNSTEDIRVTILTAANVDTLNKIATDSDDAEILFAVFNHGKCSDEIKVNVCNKADADLLNEIATSRDDSKILSLVAQQDNCNEATDAIVVNKPNTAAADLAIIAKRTTSYRVLSAIVAHENFKEDNEDIATFVIDNLYTKEDDLLRIINKTIKATVLSKIFDKLGAKAYDDLINNKYTSAANLATIAAQAGSAVELEAILGSGSLNCTADEVLNAIRNNVNATPEVRQVVEDRRLGSDNAVAVAKTFLESPEGIAAVQAALIQNCPALSEYGTCELIKALCAEKQAELEQELRDRVDAQNPRNQDELKARVAELLAGELQNPETKLTAYTTRLVEQVVTNNDPFLSGFVDACKSNPSLQDLASKKVQEVLLTTGVANEDEVKEEVKAELTQFVMNESNINIKALNTVIAGNLINAGASILNISNTFGENAGAAAARARFKK